MRKQTTLWTCKDGTRIRICDMGDRHLANTIAMLERCASKLDAWICTQSNPFRGGIAADMFDTQQEALLSGEDQTEPSDVCPLYTNLIDEQTRREYA